jgi:hypothetical protein
MNEISGVTVKMKIRGEMQQRWDNPTRRELISLIAQLKEKVEKGQIVDQFEIIREILVN